MYSFPDLTIETTIEGDGTVEEGFGSALSCSEDVITVGAPGFDSNTGKVYVFNATATTFDMLASFFPDVTDANTANGRFGFDLTVKGERIFVGAPGYSNDLGRVYIYDTEGTFKSATTGLDEGGNFGYSMAASTRRFVIGAPFSNDVGIQSGAAYEYKLSGDLDQVDDLPSGTKLSAGDEVADGSCFGFSTASLGNTILVSAPQIKNGALIAEMYYYGNNNIPITFPHPASDNVGDQLFYDMALSGGLAMFGAPESDDGLGRAYFVRIQDYLAQIA